MTERLFDAVAGALFGVIWGLLIALAIFMFTHHWHIGLIGWSAGVFALIALLFGNFSPEVFHELIRYVWEELIASFTNVLVSLPDRSDQGGYLRSVLSLGFGTGIVLCIWLWEY